MLYNIYDNVYDNFYDNFYDNNEDQIDRDNYKNEPAISDKYHQMISL